MSLGDRLGIAGLIVALIAIATGYLWPEKKGVGWVALALAGSLLLGWATLEIKQQLTSSRMSLYGSLLVGALVGMVVAALIWFSQPPSDRGNAEKPKEVSSPSTAAPIPIVKDANAGGESLASIDSRKKDSSHDRNATAEINYANGLGFQAGIVGGDYPEGIVIGGVKWQRSYTDIRVAIRNVLNVPVEKIDLVIRFDIHIADARQFGTLVPEVSIAPGDSSVTPTSLRGTDSSGALMTVPVVPTGPVIAPSYHIICPRLSAGGRVSVIVATVGMNPPSGDGGSLKLPENASADRRPPKIISIQGHYETGVVDGAKRFPVEYQHEFH